MQHQQDIIIITAAGRKTWLRERLTPSAWVRMFGEGVMGGYKEKMDVLRAVDDRIFDWLKDLHQLSKQMRHSAKAARYVDVAILLSKINKRLEDVKTVSKDVKKLTEEEVLPFELHHEQELPSDELFAEDDEGLTSEAGFANWMGKTDYGRKWIAKRLENEVRAKRRVAVEALVKKTEEVVAKVQAKLGELSKARASGNIGTYVSVLNDIGKEQLAYQAFFKPIYRENLEPLVQLAIIEKKKLDKLEAERAKEEADTKSLVQKSVEEMHKQPTGKELTDEQIQKFVDEHERPADLGGKMPEAPRRVSGPGDLLKVPEKPTAPESTVPAKTTPPGGHLPEAFVGPGQSVLPIPERRPGAFMGAETAGPTPLSLIEQQTGGPIAIKDFQKKGPEASKATKTETTAKPAKTQATTSRTSRRRQNPAATKQTETKPADESKAEASSHVQDILLKTSHQNFVNELVKASDANDPYLLAAMLVKYAGQIEEDDLDKSLQLLAIAEGIIDEQ